MAPTIRTRAGVGILFAALFLLVSSVSAPSVQAQAVTFGVRGGVSTATLHRDEDRGIGRSTGPVVGVTLEHERSDRFSVQTGLTWVRKGAEGTAQGFEEPLAVALELDYLQLPVVARVRLLPDALLRPVVFAGGAVAFELACRSQTEEGELAITFGCGQAGGDDVRNQVDAGLLFGMGLEHERGPITIVLEGQYDLGLVALADVPESESWRNRSLSLTAGLSFAP